MSSIKLAKGTSVITPYGKGTIIGYDLPNHDCWRYMVKIEHWNNESDIFSALARTQERQGGLAFMPSDVTAILPGLERKSED